ncbi:MAG: hypothetical protein AAGG46_08935, partial [Planctomycetota bacterium]
LDDATRQAALAGLSDTIDASPNDIDARYVRAVARHFDGDPAAAQRDFLRLRQMTGGDPAVEAFLPAAAAEGGPAP